MSTEKKKGLFKSFKEFIAKGNVLDLAVAVIIGGAFGKIVTSFVNDILMPPIGVILGNIDFKKLKLVLQDGVPAVEEQGKVVTEAIPEVSINYGMFIQNTVDFIIIAFCIFLVVRFAERFREKKAAEPAKPSDEVLLLTEIRDLLKKQD